MKRSTERILTTHVGSLARPDALVPLLRAKDRGQPYDRESYVRLVREAVADVVRKRTEAGVDVVNDGEQGRASFYGYIVERFTGFAANRRLLGRRATPGRRAATTGRSPITTRGPSASRNGPAVVGATAATASTCARGR